MKTTNLIRATFLISEFLLVLGCSKQVKPGASSSSPTVLQITLTDSLGNPWPGAQVNLYASQQDFYNEVHAVDTTKVSDINGQVSFTGLDSIAYYWLAKSDCKSNLKLYHLQNPLPLYTTTRVTSALTGYGTIRLENISGYPYHYYVRGLDYGIIDAGRYTLCTYEAIGSFTVRMVQVSGYTTTPRDTTIVSQLACGTTDVVKGP